jgi:hypothetical protein
VRWHGRCLQAGDSQARGRCARSRSQSGTETDRKASATWLTPEAFEALEKVTLLGLSVPLLELTGSFTGMDGTRLEGHALLGVACIRGDDGLFVKMIGPEDLVRAERQNFLAFVASLEERP